jgi:glucose-6-phosphate isomerase
VWGINSFDQWGVELGKVLGVVVRKHLEAERKGASSDAKFIPATATLIGKYCAK